MIMKSAINIAEQGNHPIFRAQFVFWLHQVAEFRGMELDCFEIGHLLGRGHRHERVDSLGRKGCSFVDIAFEGILLEEGREWFLGR